MICWGGRWLSISSQWCWVVGREEEAGLGDVVWAGWEHMMTCYYLLKMSDAQQDHGGTTHVGLTDVTSWIYSSDLENPIGGELNVLTFALDFSSDEHKVIWLFGSQSHCYFFKGLSLMPHIKLSITDISTLLTAVIFLISTYWYN